MTTDNSNNATDDLKKAAAEKAAENLKHGMIVGLGSGTTATFAVSAIGQLVKNGLRIIGIPTSEKTAQQAESLGIPLSNLGEYPAIDVTIDGADEIQPHSLNLIKGGGGNLLREKIVAASSKQLIIVADRTKIVERLGSHAPIPVEVAQFGWQSTAKRLTELGSTPTLRKGADGEKFLTDGGNYILDCNFGPIYSADTLQSHLDATVGVVEHGLFIGLASRAIVGDTEGIRVLERA